MNDKSKKIILDEYALLAYLNDEPGSAQVQEALKDAAQGNSTVLISAATLGSVLKVVEKNLGLVKTQETLAAINQLPIKVEPIDTQRELDITHLRTQFKLGYESASAAELTISEKGELYTGFAEYMRVQELMRINWLSKLEGTNNPKREKVKENIYLRDLESYNDYEDMAVLFTIEEDISATAEKLKEELERKKDYTQVRIAEDGNRNFLGFYWVEKDLAAEGKGLLYLIVKKENRKAGAGGCLHEDMLGYAVKESLQKLRVEVGDDDPDSIEFATQLGYSEYKHLIPMELDLKKLDFSPYLEMIDHLKGEGFQFTNMAELGDSVDMQRKLYELNESSAMDTLGSDGSRSWIDFEDFRKNVCQRPWYKPEGQKVVIDSKNGRFAGMCAIGMFDGQGYNLHTGVDRDYRGRHLAQAVKATGLLYARDVLKVDKIFTHHNSVNLPMLAIDRKFGYVPQAGTLVMEKLL